MVPPVLYVRLPYNRRAYSVLTLELGSSSFEGGHGGGLLIRQFSFLASLYSTRLQRYACFLWKRFTIVRPSYKDPSVRHRDGEGGLAKSPFRCM